MLLITGGGGMAMRALRGALEKSSISHYVFLYRELDIADPEAVQKLLESRQVHWLVNGAAYTKVDALKPATRRRCRNVLNMADGIVITGPSGST